MNYNKLTREEATNRLREHDEADWSDDRLWNEVIEPADVLYYLDAFGDLSLAINCQALPKDLPDRVIENVDEYDVFNDWNGGINETSCPICSRDFYEFDWKYDYLYIDEFGHNHDFVEYVTDVGGFYWDSTGEYRVMCENCRDDRNFSRMEPEPEVGEVRVFYGETDEFSRFSHNRGIIRWDFEWDMDFQKSTDIWNHRAGDGTPVEGQEIAAAFAQGYSETKAIMEEIGFKRIHVKEIDQNVRGIRKFWKYAMDVLVKWGTLDYDSMKNEPTHPDFEFTYFIDGKHQAWIPSENFEEFKSELIYQTYQEANDYESAKLYQESQLA